MVGNTDRHGEYATPLQWATTIRDAVEGPLENYPDRVRIWAKSTYETLKQADELDLNGNVNEQ